MEEFEFAHEDKLSMASDPPAKQGCSDFSEPGPKDLRGFASNDTRPYVDRDSFVGEQFASYPNDTSKNASKEIVTPPRSSAKAATPSSRESVTNSYPPFPPFLLRKGRTAYRRSRKILRTGSEAIQEAKGRGSCAARGDKARKRKRELSMDEKMNTGPEEFSFRGSCSCDRVPLPRHPKSSEKEKYKRINSQNNTFDQGRSTETRNFCLNPSEWKDYSTSHSTLNTRSRDKSSQNLWRISNCNELKSRKITEIISNETISPSVSEDIETFDHQQNGGASFQLDKVEQRKTYEYCNVTPIDANSRNVARTGEGFSSDEENQKDVSCIKLKFAGSQHSSPRSSFSQGSLFAPDGGDEKCENINKPGTQASSPSKENDRKSSEEAKTVPSDDCARSDGVNNLLLNNKLTSINSDKIIERILNQSTTAVHSFSQTGAVCKAHSNFHEDNENIIISFRKGESALGCEHVFTEDVPNGNNFSILRTFKQPNVTKSQTYHTEIAATVGVKHPPGKLSASCAKSVSAPPFFVGDVPQILVPLEPPPLATSTSSIRSNGSNKRKHRSRRFVLGPFLKSDAYRSDKKSTTRPPSPVTSPTVVLGQHSLSRDATDVQDAGNHRMIVDDLSYLCSAILHAKTKSKHVWKDQKVRKDQILGRFICKHTSATALAACDLADMISQSEIRSTMFMLGLASSFNAILEAISCAPPAKDLSTDCREIILGCDGVQEAQKNCYQVPNFDDIKLSPAVSEYSPPTGGVDSRSKSVRHNNVDGELFGSIDASIGNEEKSQLAEDHCKYDDIVLKALAAVSYFVVLDLTRPERLTGKLSGTDFRKGIGQARKVFLHHSLALQGIARIISNDPVVCSFMTQLDKNLRRQGVPSHAIISSTVRQSEDEHSCHSSCNETSHAGIDFEPKLTDWLSNPGEVSDPTKIGRKRSRRRIQSQTQHYTKPCNVVKASYGGLHSIEEVEDVFLPESPITRLAETPDYTPNELAKLAHQSPHKSLDETPVRSRTLFHFHHFSPSKISNCPSISSLDEITGKPPTDISEITEQNNSSRFHKKITQAVNRATPSLSDGASYNQIKTDATTAKDNTKCSHCCTWSAAMIPLGNKPWLERLHSGGTMGRDYISSSSLAIIAVDRLLSGRDQDYQSVDGDDDGDDEIFGSDGHQQHGNSLLRNPILYANEMLRKSGSLPDYARSMVETLAALLLACKPNISEAPRKKYNWCSECTSYLHQRASSLSEIIDNLCCLSADVSKTLSRDRYLLVPSLLRIIAELAFIHDIEHSSFIGETIIMALKTLTSLTHENEAACSQMLEMHPWNVQTTVMSKQKNSGLSEPSYRVTGVEIIFSLLVETVSLKQKPPPDVVKIDNDKLVEKLQFDTIIFCLNVLTNTVEMTPNFSKKIILNLVICTANRKEKPNFVPDEAILVISWLSKWLVSETQCFRHAIMKGSFGSTSKSLSQQDLTNNATTDGDRLELKENDEGSLVISGNGFVLLAYMMLNIGNSPEVNCLPLSIEICNIVVAELPIDQEGKSDGIKFMIKTLRAFCNFYHYSVGALSVAVIAPIAKLISGLEVIAFSENQS